MTLLFSYKFAKRAAILAFLLLMAIGATGQAAQPPTQVGSEPVNFEAKQLFQNEKTQTVTAVGNVVLQQGLKILRADKMTYHMDNDTVVAEGHVSLTDADGSVHYADHAELSKDMTHGFVQNILSLLKNGDRFTARKAQKQGERTKLSQASYTPCKVCAANPHPLWQLKAKEIIYNEKTKDVKYKNAHLDFLGIPLFWVPIFSHADPNVKQRSGLLKPHAGWSDTLGTFYRQPYYYGLAENKDLTLTMMPTTREGILSQAEWRQRFQNGQIRLSGSFVQSDRRNPDGTIDPNVLRGDISGDGLFDINEKWRTGFTFRRVSDSEYLRLYDLDNRDILENEIFAERFAGRNYSRVSALNIQDLRLDVQADQAEVLPFAEHHMLTDPQAILGGRGSLDLSFLDLQRPGSGQDLQRLSTNIGWEKRRVDTATGLSLKYSAGIRGDVAFIQNNVLDQGNHTYTARGQFYSSVLSTYPLVRRLNTAQVVVEPLLGLSYATPANNNPEEFPNEDSLDVQIDANSLFSDNRFPGLDRQEDGLRLNYGARTGWFADDGKFAKVFIGQSYRFTGENDIFPDGSGLEQALSDIVAQFSVGFEDQLNANYSIQFDHETFAVRRHELNFQAGNKPLRVNTRFIYLDAIGGTGFVEPRAQAEMGALYHFSSHWSADSKVLADFGEDQGIRRAAIGLHYSDDCFSMSVEGRRNLIDDGVGESGSSLTFRLGFKNLGEVSSPALRIGENPVPRATAPPP